MHDNMNITALLAGLSARNGDRPKYLALADAVEQAFREHELPPGTALPPQRALARALGVTLGTVSRAYAEAATRGLVEASVGRGTFIRVQRPDVDVMPPEAAEGGEAALTRRTASRRKDLLQMPETTLFSARNRPCTISALSLPSSISIPLFRKGCES